MQNWTSKLQLNGFLFSREVVSSCLWCPWLLLSTSYLFRLMFWVYLSQGLHVPFFCACLILRRLLLGESSRIIHGILWCVQWLDDSQLPLMLSNWCSMQRVNTFFFDLPIYLPLHKQSNWYTLGWLVHNSFGLFWYRMLCKFFSGLKVMSLFTFLNFFPNFWSNIKYPRDFLGVAVMVTAIDFLFGIMVYN